jgi:hypothetical protein
MAVEKAPVSLRALVGRINRKLKPQDQMMKRKRGGWRVEAEHRGDPGFYVVDFTRNTVVAEYANPEAWGRDLGCLAPWEEVVRGGKGVVARTAESARQAMLAQGAQLSPLESAMSTAYRRNLTYEGLARPRDQAGDVLWIDFSAGGWRSG